jgi:hypothetical protein
MPQRRCRPHHKGTFLHQSALLGELPPGDGRCSVKRALVIPSSGRLRVIRVAFAMSATRSGYPPTPERLRHHSEPTLRANCGSSQMRCVAFGPGGADVDRVRARPVSCEHEMEVMVVTPAPAPRCQCGRLSADRSAPRQSRFRLRYGRCLSWLFRLRRMRWPGQRPS